MSNTATLLDSVRFRSYNVTGLRIDDVTRAEVLRAVESFVAEGGFHHLVVPNIDCLLHAHEDETYRAIVNTAALSIPDGMWLKRGLRLLGVRLRENVTGRLLVRPLCKLSAEKGWKVYILASAPGIAPIAAQHLVRDYPGLQIVAARSPSFQFVNDREETDDILTEMNRLAPDLLFIGVGAPKSDLWVHNFRDRIPAKVAIGVGYAFDVIAGKTAEAPRWMTHTGFEWLFRMMQEPKRLCRRYLARDPKAFHLILGQRLRGISTEWPPEQA